MCAQLRPQLILREKYVVQLDAHQRGDGLIPKLTIGMGYESSFTSQQVLATAGIHLIQHCAAANPSKTGVAINIGGDNHMGLVLNGYRPGVIWWVFPPS